MPNQKRTLVVEIRKDLAAEYRAAYVRAFGRNRYDRASLAKFMAGFVEDRLCEEIDFLEEEASDQRE
jgi:hypothetical protein